MDKHTLADYPAPGFVTTIERDGARATSVTVAGPDVTAALLRQVAVGRLVSESARAQPIPVDDETLQRIREDRRKTPESVSVVWSLYSYAVETGRPPAKFVQEQLGLSPATAGRWISDAKKLHAQ